MSLVLLAPLAGWVSPLEEVPDPVFAGRILGDGVAVDPTGSQLCAPCDGLITALAHHAVTIRAANGAEILVHVGLETVALKGEGFTALAEQGQTVKAGTPILSFDLDVLVPAAKSLISPVVIANGEAYTIVSRTQDSEVALGDVLMEIVATGDAAATKDASEESASRDAVVQSEHGLHARPAAELAQAAKTHSGEVILSCRGRAANAKSTVAVMALGIACGDRVTLSAKGNGAEALVMQLATLLGKTQLDGGAVHEAAAPVAIHAGSRLYGVCAAPGRATGTAFLLHRSESPVVEAGRGIAAETRALQMALAAVQALLETAAASGARRDILEAHRELLADPELVAAARKAIEEGKSAAFAWRRAVRGFAVVFRGLADARLRERAADLADLERQVLAVLMPETVVQEADLPSAAILVAEEILPSDLTRFEAKNIAGLVSSGGGPTSHVAILAAAMNIPALVGVGPAALVIVEGSTLLLDAGAGFVETAPSDDDLAAAKEGAEKSSRRIAREQAEAGALCFTADGTRIEIFANLGKGAGEAAQAVAMGAEGCGLLRTEFLFMDRATPPDEDEQYRSYQAIADALEGRRFVLRSFDIGADKPVSYLSFPREDNPQLGLRGIRAGLVWPDLLRTQLKAALQVSPPGACKILLPMITGLGELRAVRAMIAVLCAESGAPLPALGVMIETPASAVLADQLVREADFLSIGTNDLTQYVLAIDRTHPRLSRHLDGLHPAVLRLIGRTADAAQAAGKPVAVCGGLAGDPAAAAILLGLGIRELSVPAPAIAHLKAVIRDLRIGACRALARDALNRDSADAVRALIGETER